MPLRVSCSCGPRLVLADHLRKSIRCPSCCAVVVLTRGWSSFNGPEQQTSLHFAAGKKCTSYRLCTAAAFVVRCRLEHCAANGGVRPRVISLIGTSPIPTGSFASN